MNQISEERRVFVQQKLDEWCANGGYKDSNVNMLTLSRTLCISKNELSLFFDQCLHSNFRIWLSEIRLNAAKKMMLEYPDYSNDIISAECGFSFVVFCRNTGQACFWRGLSFPTSQSGFFKKIQIGGKQKCSTTQTLIPFALRKRMVKNATL